MLCGRENRYLYGDKRAPPGWQDHFEKTMLTLGVRTRLLREEGRLTQGHDHCGEAKTYRELLCATGENVETQACGVH